MKYPLIHRGFFRELFRQLRTKGIVGTVLLQSINLILFSVMVTRDPLETAFGGLDARLIALPMLIFLYVFVPIMVFGAYRWLNKRVQSDFYHAIPLTRTQTYASTTLAILLWLLIALGSYAIVNVLLFTVFGYPVNRLLYFCVFVNMCIAAIAITGAFSLGSALSGTRFVAFFSSAVILFLPRAFLTAFWILTECDSGFSVPFSQLPFFLNPAFNIAATPIHSLVYGINYANVLAMLYSLVYASGLLVLGAVAFHRRKSEASDIPYTSKVLQTITRVCFGMPSLSLVTLILNVYIPLRRTEDFLPVQISTPLIVTSVLFSFLFYCLYELISSKKMKKVVKAMPAYGFCLLVSLFLILVPNLVAKLRPIANVSVAEIRSYRINNESTLISPTGIDGTETYPMYLLHRHTFTDEKGKALIMTQSKENVKNGTRGYGFLVSDTRAVVNTGGLFQKVVDLSGGYYDSASILNKLQKTCMNDASFREELFSYPKGTIWYHCDGLTHSEAREVGRLFREDYEKLSEAERETLFAVSLDPTGNREKQAMDLTIDLYISRGAENCTMQYFVNELTPNAAKAMLGYLNARNEENVRKALKELVAWMEHPRVDPSVTRFFIGTKGLSTYSLDYSDTDQGIVTPKDAYPAEYQILKALSEAPVATDADRCVTFSTYNVEFDFTGSSFAWHTAGFRVDEAMYAIIQQYLAAGSLDGVHIAYEGV